MQSTLAELGTMFQRFSSILSEQGEAISLIDSNVEASLMHAEDAHDQLFAYKKNILNNRGLILKTFGILFFIIVLYGMVGS